MATGRCVRVRLAAGPRCMPGGRRKPRQPHLGKIPISSKGDGQGRYPNGACAAHQTNKSPLFPNAARGCSLKQAPSHGEPGHIARVH